MNASQIIAKLKAMRNEKNIKGMARFGINTNCTIGVPIPFLVDIARSEKKNHSLALELWDSGIHEAKILAALIDDPEKVSEKQMEKWVKDFDSWDVCDQVCMRLFDKKPFSYRKAVEWSARKEEFVKRAGFALIATLSVHDKKATDKDFEKFFPIIKREATDERNFVRKAVNWALRQIGKRNKRLNKRAIAVAKQILKENAQSKSARWIAKDALRELEEKRKKLFA